jgi:hypothetical protein
VESLGLLGAFVFGIHLYAAWTPLIFGMWLILFIRFGLLPWLHDRSETTTVTDQKDHITKRANRAMLRIALIGVPITLLLCGNLLVLEELSYLVESIVGESIVGVILEVLYGPVRVAILVEEWLAIICFFGVRYLLHRLETPLDQQQRTSWYVISAILLTGVLTVLVGLGWSIYLNVSPPDWAGLEEFGFATTTAIAPFTGFLTLGLVLMLAITLIQARDIEKGGKSQNQRARLAQKTTLVFLVAFVFLSAIGGAWSVYIFRLWSEGQLFYAP